MSALKLRPGVVYVLNGKLMSLCPECHTLIRVDKPLLGSLHVCVPRKT